MPSSPKTHTVEKIGGTSMSRLPELVDTIFRHYGATGRRMFVVSAYAGITNALLEHKKTGKDGVYSLFCQDRSWAWNEALTGVLNRMHEINAGLFSIEADRLQADAFIRDRIEGVRGCLVDLQRLCASGHFQLGDHLRTVREMLSSLGETHAAFTAALFLQRQGLPACCVDLSGWRCSETSSLDDCLQQAIAGLDLDLQIPILTGYAHCREGLMGSFDRGYSEITFSRLAVLSGATEAVIHKEFHLSSADPNLVGDDKALPIGRTNYDVTDQLSDIGMEAIHPQAAKGLRQAGIPLRIKHSFEPNHDGTLITGDYRSAKACVEIIAGQPRVLAVSYHNQDMVGQSGDNAKLAALLHKQGLHYLAKDTNANTITHYLSAPLDRIERYRAGIQQILPGAISTEKVAAISVIGSNMSIPGILARAAQALASAGINILALHQNLRHVDMRIFVSRDDYQPAIRALHKELIENLVDALDADNNPVDIASALAMA